MSNLITMEVSNKINSAITRELYEIDTETDYAIILERLQQVEKAMDMCVSLDDAWLMAMYCAKLWMPTPQSKAFEYNSIEYNTVEIFCMCVIKARC